MIKATDREFKTFYEIPILIVGKVHEPDPDIGSTELSSEIQIFLTKKNKEGKVEKLDITDWIDNKFDMQCLKEEFEQDYRDEVIDMQRCEEIRVWEY